MLNTEYLGLKLKSPVIVSSGPLTQNAVSLKKCEEAGAGAVVLKSIFEEQIEADVSAGVVDLMRNPVIRWMFRNVVIYRDANDNIKMDKKRSTEKIDGCVAMANAYGAYMSADVDEYADIGPAFLNI